MARSKWKFPYTSKELVALNKDEIKQLKIYSRSSVILNEYIDNIFYIHNGRSFYKLIVTKEMVGHKFGQYAFTKKKPVFKK